MAPQYRTDAHVDATRRVSRWAAYLHKQRVDATPALNKAHAQMQHLFTHETVADGETLNLQAETRRQKRLARALSREVFAGMYEGCPPLDKPAAGTELIETAHQMIASLPETKALAKQVAGDPDLCAMAAAKLLTGVAAGLREKARKEAEKRSQSRRRRSRRERRAEQDAPADPNGDLRRALRQAAGEASKDAVEIQQALNGLQAGLGNCPGRKDHDGTSRYELAEKLRNDSRLKRIMRMAGRLQRDAASDRMANGNNGVSRMVGVEYGDALARAMPRELVNMRRGSRLRTLTMAKYVDKRLLQYRYEGEEPMGRGPMVVMLDESGSRMGENSMWASAVALACLGVATRERRACTVIGFNGGVRYVVRLDTDGVGWRHHAGSLDKKTKIGRAADVAMRVATSVPSGGTSFDPPLRCAMDLEDGVLRERADMLLVTDGHASASAQILSRLAKARADDGLRVFGLTVGGGSLGRSVQQLCDRVVDIDKAVAGGTEVEIARALP